MKDLNISKISIGDINPDPENPRIITTEETEKLKQGLNTFGLVDPLIIDLTDNNTIIGGHQRYDVLKETNPDETLTLIRLGDIGLVIRETDIKLKDKNDRRALNLALNKISGDWDYAKLDNILLGLSEENYQLELTGFDEDEIILDTSYELDNSLEEDIENELNEGVSEWDIETEYQEDIIQNDKQSRTRIWFEAGDEIKIGNHTLIMGEKNDNYYSLKIMDEVIVDLELGIKDAFIKDNKEIYDRIKRIQQSNAIKRKNL